MLVGVSRSPSRCSGANFLKTNCQVDGYTASKANMEPKKLVDSRCFSFSNGVFSGSMFAFRGVTISAFGFQEKLSPLFLGVTQKPVAIPGMSFHYYIIKFEHNRAVIKTLMTCPFYRLVNMDPYNGLFNPYITGWGITPPLFYSK